MEKIYNPAKCRTYREMIIEAILYIAPTLPADTVRGLTKSQLKDLYCTIKNNKYGTN